MLSRLAVSFIDNSSIPIDFMIKIRILLAEYICDVEASMLDLAPRRALYLYRCADCKSDLDLELSYHTTYARFLATYIVECQPTFCPHNDVDTYHREKRLHFLGSKLLSSGIFLVSSIRVLVDCC